MIFDKRKQIVGFFCSNSTLTDNTGKTPDNGIINYLTQYQNSINCFYHLSANAASLFKQMNLTFDQLWSLYEIGECHIDPDINIFYLHNKYLAIKKGFGYNDPYVQFCDVSQYIPWHIDKDYTKEYALHKAQEAYAIGSLVYNGLTELNLFPDNLTSPIRVFEKQVLNHIVLPTVDNLPEEAGKYAYYSTYGGWLESFFKGHYPETWDYDLSSAYPAELAALYDTRYGIWINTKEYQPDAVYGYMTGTADISAPFHPILFKNKEMTYTPNGSWNFQQEHEYCINKRTFDVINTYKLGTFTIDNAWWWLKRANVQPLKSIVDNLYYQKENESGIRKQNIKRIMSGIWGKLLEVKGDSFGDHFNPVWGAEVEINTRLNVFEMCMKNGILPLSIAVDGVLTDRPLNITGNGYGSWKLSSHCPALVISSGIVAVKDKEHNHDFSLDYDWLMESIKTNPDRSEYDMSKTSPVTLENAINRNMLDRLGEIEIITRTIDIVWEAKRFYEKKPKTGGELLQNRYSSDPWNISLVGKL